MDKFTVKSQEAIQNSQRLAEKRGHQQIDVEHLLWSLLEDEEGVVAQIIKRIGVNTAILRKALEEHLDRLPKVLGSTAVGQIYVTPRLKEVLEKAREQAEHLKDEYVSVEHLLMAIAGSSGYASDL